MTRFLPALALTLAACTGSQLRPMVQAPDASWSQTFLSSYRAIEAGDYLRADTLLRSYAAAHPNTPEALEAVYWRGVLALDPANPNSSVSLAAGAFDEYLRSPNGMMRRGEAMVLQRLARRLQGDDRYSMPLSAPAASVSARDSTPRDSTRQADPRDAEIARLKEELKKSNEELERIRRRLSNPPRPDPPPV